MPADSISAGDTNKRDFAADISKHETQGLPAYHENSLTSEEEWNKYQEEYEKAWHAAPVLHHRGSDRIITPPHQPTTTAATGGTASAVGIPAAELFPERYRGQVL